MTLFTITYLFRDERLIQLTCPGDAACHIYSTLLASGVATHIRVFHHCSELDPEKGMCQKEER